MNLEAYLPLKVFEILMVFARTSSAMLLLPGIGETFVPMRVRLMFSAMLALAVGPVIAPQLPPEPASPAGLLVLLQHLYGASQLSVSALQLFAVGGILAPQCALPGAATYR